MDMASQSQDGSSRLRAKVVDESMDTSSSTEELDIDHEEWEELVKEQTANWLATHGTKLFALEASKFLAAQEKKKNLRSYR